MMDVVRLLLASVFAVAAVAKLADLRGAAVAAQSFGAPRRAALPAALLVVLIELAIAAALVPPATARIAAGAGATLLVVFSGAIVLARLRGRTPDCHCFGRLHSAPAGWGTIARNAALATVMLVVVSRPAAGPTTLDVVAAGIATVVVTQAVLSFVLLRRYGRALRRIEELEAADDRPAALEAGSEAPAFALPGLDGREITLAGLLDRARPLLLVFADPGCGPCQALMPRVAGWQRSLADRLTVAVVSRGEPEDSAPLLGEHGVANVLLQEDRELAALYAIEATPSAVLIGAGGRIERAGVAGALAIEELVRSRTPLPETAARQAGSGRAPAIAAAALAGGLVAAASAPASPGARSQQPANPEMQAIDAALKAAGPRLVAASQRSNRAVRAQATLREGVTVRKQRTAARQALAAERREVVALRATVAKLAETTVEAHNVKLIVDNCLSLLARSVLKRQQAIGAAPKVGLRLVEEGQQLFLASFAAGVAAGKLLEQKR